MICGDMQQKSYLRYPVRYFCVRSKSPHVHVLSFMTGVFRCHLGYNISRNIPKNHVQKKMAPFKQTKRCKNNMTHFLVGYVNFLECIMYIFI